MPGIVRKTDDSAGAPLVGGSPNVFVNAQPAVRVGDPVEGHGLNHDAPIMSGFSTNVFANKLEICRAGDIASCGHPATGSSNVFANGS